MAVLPKLPFPNWYPKVPYHVLPHATGFSSRNSTPYFWLTSSTLTSLARKSMHVFSQICMSCCPESTREPASLPLMRMRWPQPLACSMPCMRCVW